MPLDTTSAAAAGLIFATVLFFILGLASQSGGSSVARQRLESFKRGATPDEALPEVRTFSDRVITPLLHGIIGGLGAILPKSILTGVEKKLVIAGEPMTMSGFLTMVVVSTAGAAGFGLLIMLVAGGGQVTLTTIGVIAGITLVGFYLPFWIVNSRARQRQAAIIKSLPDAFDLITTCVEAGLGLDAALSRVAEKVQGPFAQELSRSLREIALGKSRRDALKELGDRTLVP